MTSRCCSKTRDLNFWVAKKSQTWGPGPGNETPKRDSKNRARKQGLEKFEDAMTRHQTWPADSRHAFFYATFFFEIPWVDRSTKNFWSTTFCLHFLHFISKNSKTESIFFVQTARKQDSFVMLRIAQIILIKKWNSMKKVQEFCRMWNFSQKKNYFWIIFFWAKVNKIR